MLEFHVTLILLWRSRYEDIQCVFMNLRATRSERKGTSGLPRRLSSLEGYCLSTIPASSGEQFCGETTNPLS